MIPAGRQCSFWSSDGVLGNRPVPPPALPILPGMWKWCGAAGDTGAQQLSGQPIDYAQVAREKRSV